MEGIELPSGVFPGDYCESGQLHVVDGQQIYSPNCSRFVKIPKVDDQLNIFLPVPIHLQESRCHTTATTPSTDNQNPSSSTMSLRQGESGRKKTQYYDFSTIKLAMYQQPRWWTLHWGWASFIPFRPDYDDMFFTLSTIRLPADLVEVVGSSPPRYSLPGFVLKEWVELEGHLYNIAHHLSILAQTNIVKPVLPWVFGYKKSYTSRSRGLYAMWRSRDWFAVWIGMVSYLIAKAQTRQRELSGYPNFAIPSWTAYLISKNYDPAWVDYFDTSLLGYRSRRRVGVFIDPSSGIANQPPVEWFCEHRVPVWYILGPQPQSIPTFVASGNQDTPLNIIPSSSTTPTLTNAISPSSSSNIIAQEDDACKKFFAQRAERNKLLMAKESPSQRRSREDRERNPPSSAKVFVWVEDDSGRLVREAVSRRERSDTLFSFADDEKRYDSFSNEYDCSETFGSGLGISGLDYFEAGLESMDVSAEEIEGDESLLADAPITSLDMERTANNDGQIFDSDWIPNHCHDGSTDRAEQEILDILRLYFGYTPPLPTPPNAPISSESEQKNFLKILGLPWKSFPLEAFQRLRVISAFHFIRRLCSKGEIQVDEWDFDRNHRESVVLSRRIKSIQRVHQQSPNPGLGKVLYMFDFGSQSTTVWKLAVTSAADAVMVCRLPPQYDETDIALFLLQNGIPFHTLQDPDSISTTRPRELLVEYPYRPAKYQFTVKDYAVYIERTSRLLRGPKGRAALMKGGYLWRVAVPVVSFHSVLGGPVPQSTNYLEAVAEDGKILVDNLLSEMEMDLLCGMYQCATGEGDQVAKRSWYPLHYTYENSGHDYGRWTSNSETMFDVFKSRTARPAPANKWRDALRGTGDQRRVRAVIEKQSLDLIVSRFDWHSYT